VVLAEEGRITPDVLPPEIRDEPAEHVSHVFPLPAAGVDFERVEESLLRQAVERSGGVHTRGAELLRMSYKTFIYRLKKFGIIPA
jgi:transcriptional regulator of acetoin/glycerol metabolism